MNNIIQISETDRLTFNSSEKNSDSSRNTTAQKTELVYRTISKLQEEIEKKTMKGPEDLRLVMCAKRLKNKLEASIPHLATTSVPGCCHYNGKDYLETVVTIAEKQERIENAIHTLKAMKQIDIKVHDYFQKTLEKLKNGQNVPLPDFYHATRCGILGIIQTRVIRQSRFGALGPGTYISNNNEGHYGYGPHAFAIDGKCLRDSPARYIDVEKTHHVDIYISFWIAVIKEIPITGETVAFIAAPNNDIPSLKEALKAKNLHIEIIDRPTSETIHRIFDLSNQKSELPSFLWRRVSEYTNLPPNFTPRSLEGTPEASPPLSA